ncbi:hypothetical protein [Kitasatospora sp. NPDC097643]|uniref:hypothetical protein n=1 Tax=Kitasatospora sp. NPDC097643 TaxID=3157230 RepID=UPI003326A1E6
MTPLRAGLHVRGRGTSLTLEGSRALPALWQLLAPRLGPDPEPEPVGEPTGERVAAALATVTARLREYDLLVDHPDGVELPPWPGSVADRPAQAAAELAAARPVVAAADPDGLPLAEAVARALRRAGATPTVVAEPGLAAGLVLVADGTVAVAVQGDADGGFVTAPADPARTRADATTLAASLGTSSTPPPPALTALLAGAAAHRLLCAVAGLPDPADPVDPVGAPADAPTAAEGVPPSDAPPGDPRLLAGRPAVLVAEAHPLRADHHPWAAAPGPVAAPPEHLAEALRRITALGDPRLGVIDAPAPGALSQLPVPLVSCRTPSGTLVAGAVRTDLARLAAACRSVELHLADTELADTELAAPVVGADPDHALGRALRRAAHALPAVPVGPGAAGWRDHPQAAHWWTTLTRSLGTAPDLTISQLVAGQAFMAVLRLPSPAAGTPPVVLGRAVEATPADAVAVAALAALTRRTAAAHGLAAAHHTTLSGAAAPLAAAGLRPAAWTDEGWTDRWLTALAAREPELQAALLHTTGLRVAVWHPVAPAARSLANALQGCGFTALVPTEGPR